MTLSGSHPYGSKGEARTWDKIYKYNYYTSTTLHIQEASGCSARWAGDDVTRALSSWDKGHVLKDGVSRPINTSGSWRRRARYSKMASHYPMIVRTRTGEVEPAALSGGSTSGENSPAGPPGPALSHWNDSRDPDNAREPYDALGGSEITTLYAG